MPLPTSNFAFLSAHDAQLMQLGAQAERYFRDDPVTALIKLRQFAELLSKLIAAYHALLNERDNFDDILRRLSYDRVVPRDIADIFHALRKSGNEAAHENKGSHSDALTALRLARQLGVWFHRTYGKKPDFKPGPFIPPPEPADATTPLKEEIEALRRRVAESEDAAGRARREAEEHARARETAEDRLRREAEEGRVWQQLAEHAEAEKAALAASLAAIQDAGRRGVAVSAALAVKVDDLAHLEAIQAVAEQAPGPEIAALVESGKDAAEKIDLDEAETRAVIDARLSDAGWEADTTALRYSKGTRPVRGRNLAIAEWPTASGPADYALFAGLTLIGIVEAKRQHTDVPAVIDQAERYSSGVNASADFMFAGGGPWGAFKVPFVFSTNGRPYLKQVETKSGIWTRDVRRPANHRHAIVGWPKPEDLLGQLEIDVDAATAALKEMAFNFGFPLRDYQKAAIQAVETVLDAGRREMLLGMATGTGKTKLAIALLYRLLAAKRFRRICFVVDRETLGEQAGDEFTTTRVVSGKTFADIFGLKRLEDRTPESETKVHICTIQGLVRRVLNPADESEKPSVCQYDLVVIDECHRGYLLDRDMSEDEMVFRNQNDYISKYRRVLDYFDAVKIGLTATPALHTTEIFGESIFTYSYRQAVIDGFLIDHEPPVRIETALARSGIGFSEGEQVEYIAPATGAISLASLPDEIRFEVEQFNKQVVTKPFNRAVAEELANHIDPYAPDTGKTLIFAVNNDHADMVVAEIKEAFKNKYGEIDDAAVKKITGSVDTPLKWIRAFRNDSDPRIVVTVDLLTTGVDVPSITNLVFLRRVNSRILYDQMIGRATRPCEKINKEVFRIFDAVDLYPHLQNFTAMKPVVVDPKKDFADLVDELIAATDDVHRELVRGELAVKLRRRLKKLNAEAKQRYAAVAGETPEATLKRLREDTPAALSAWFASHAAIGDLLDRQERAEHRLPISHHPDEVVSVTRGYGDGVSRPEDFLDGFTRWVKDNENTIAALKVVTQRPRDLTRADLKALRAALDEKGYSEASLRTAWSEAKNVDIAASIIGYVRQAALGDPLIPYGDRVRAAMQRIMAGRAWTAPQKQWLTKIGDQIEQEIVVDRDALDQEPFSNNGGFKHINKVFEGKLEDVLNRINDEIWEKTG